MLGLAVPQTTASDCSPRRTSVFRNSFQTLEITLLLSRAWSMASKLLWKVARFSCSLSPSDPPSIFDSAARNRSACGIAKQRKARKTTKASARRQVATLGPNMGARNGSSRSLYRVKISSKIFCISRAPVQLSKSTTVLGSLPIYAFQPPRPIDSLAQSEG